jgi:hypothetical protein
VQCLTISCVFAHPRIEAKKSQPKVAKQDGGHQDGAQLLCHQVVVIADDVNWLVDELARVASKQEGLAGELDGARAMLVDLKREQDGLAAEGSSLRNDITRMANKLVSVTTKEDNVMRELGGKQY